MKKIYLLLFVAFAFQSLQAQLFNQEFTTDMATVTNGVVSDANYVADPPNASQFTYMAAPVSATMSVSGGALRTTTTSTSSRWVTVRNADFASTPTAIMVTFDANITVGSSGTSAPKFVFYVGSGFANGTGMDAGSTIHSGFAIKYQNSGYYYLNTLSGTNNTTQFPENVNRTFTFVTNNTGADLTYSAPDGSIETVGDDKWDLWVGTAKLFDEQAATTGNQNINNFKFGDINGNNGRGDWIMDYLTITDLTPALPVTFTSFNGSLKSGNVELAWSTTNESNMESYDVERSLDGRSFTSVGTLTANNINRPQTYKFVDHLPFSGNSFYRIKSVGKDNKVKYTGILKISSSRKTELIVTPNPIRNNVINLQLNELQKGNYVMRLYNTGGVTIYQQSLKVNEGSSAQSIALPATTQPGTYFLVFTNGEDVFRKQVIVQ